MYRIPDPPPPKPKVFRYFGNWDEALTVAKEWGGDIVRAKDRKGWDFYPIIQDELCTFSSAEQQKERLDYLISIHGSEQGAYEELWEMEMEKKDRELEQLRQQEYEREQNERENLEPTPRTEQDERDDSDAITRLCEENFEKEWRNVFDQNLD